MPPYQMVGVLGDCRLHTRVENIQSSKVGHHERCRAEWRMQVNQAAKQGSWGNMGPLPGGLTGLGDAVSRRTQCPYPY